MVQADDGTGRRTRINKTQGTISSGGTSEEGEPSKHERPWTDVRPKRGGRPERKEPTDVSSGSSPTSTISILSRAMSVSVLTRRIHTPASSFPRLSLLPRRPVPPLVHHRLSSSRAPSEDEADDSDPLHYHPFPSLRPPRLALSFLPYPPHSIKSATILGSLPMDEEQADLSSFTENAAFRDVVLDRAVRESLEQGEERISNEAQGRIEGWVHINGEDGRLGERMLTGVAGARLSLKRSPKLTILPVWRPP